jgi:hypothetical protein
MGFAWNKAASMGVDISAVDSTGIYPLNRNRVPEYFFSISDNSETVTFMERGRPDMVLICATSTLETNSQSVLPISAGPSLGSLNITLPSDIPLKKLTDV